MSQVSFPFEGYKIRLDVPFLDASLKSCVCQMLPQSIPSKETSGIMLIQELLYFTAAFIGNLPS